MKFIIRGFVLLLLAGACVDKKQVSIENLKCEFIANPLGIDVKEPRFNWQLRSEQHGVKQIAYQILVASSLYKLNKDDGNIWNSKRVISDGSIQIKFDGKPLMSQQKYYWKVKVWDQNNTASPWSEVSTFEMALLKPSDWVAKWIGTKDPQKVKVRENIPATYFRKTFNIENRIKKARAYISGLGYYELYINGEKVGDHVLSPNQTNYDKRQVNTFENGKVANMSTRVNYETFDITNFLQAGNNIITVILGNGWYFQNERSEYLPLYYDTPRFITQMVIKDQDGSKQTIISDESWKYRNGPILDNNIYYGEIYDARLKNEIWDPKVANEKNWLPSITVRAPEGKLQAQMSPPDRVIKTIKPVALTIPKTNVSRFDFGTMFSGWVKLKIKGERGDEIKMTFFEDNGNSYEQTDTYILRGGEIEEWEPRFTWHSFRYVEVSGSSIAFTIDNLEGQVVHTDVESAGKFESSNKLFNRILSDYNKTQLDNMHGGVPTDCPHRERRGYTGDGQIAAQAAIYNFDMQSFYTKWLNDIADAQNKETGYVPNTVPYHNGGGGTPWGSAYIIIPWYMYLYYGDIGLLENHYQGMKHYVDYLKTQTDSDGLIIENQLGEWVPPTVTEIPPSFVSSAYYYYDLTLIAKIASILKKESDSNTYLALAEHTKKSFHNRYYNSELFSYSIGRQGANVFPLAFNMVPKEFIPDVFKTLVENIELKTEGHFDTGMMGTPYLLEVLTNYGRPDLAYTIMNRKDFPSFGYNIEKGATTLWETWTGNESHSHPMFGSVTAWFYQGLGGINPNPKNPGFKHIIIKPNPIDELDFVNTTYSSVYGDIQSNWALKNGDFKLKVIIPPNTTASIYIPGEFADNIITDDNNISFIGAANNRIQYDVPSGVYTFISNKIENLMKAPMLSIPVIHPPDSTLFSPDSVWVNIYQDSKNAEIRYTIDGSEPDKKSNLYSQKFLLSHSADIKAKVFKDGQDAGFTKTNKIVFIDSLKNGLGYKYYVGSWNELPDFSKLDPVSNGIVYNVGLLEIETLGNQFGIVFNGGIEIRHDGDYSFFLRSNDGSKLWIDNKEIIDADGTHSFKEISGDLFLKKGKHKIRLEYFQAGGGKGLELLYEGPQKEKQHIPADMFDYSSDD
jgi:alpha-L-rhamnosidase